MKSMNTKFSFTSAAAENLISWYRSNKRDLPWRHTCDPYHIWISEIMLQQTRVEAVIPKYLHFVEELPNVQELALCSDDRLMKLWEGLGYYSRAVNLKKCAGAICSLYNGRFPQNYKDLIGLPGIGPYTAGAICSIAFGIGIPAVDGNVLRVITRLCGIKDDIREQQTKETINDLIASYYQSESPDAEAVRDLTQGFMDLGALICLPGGDPHCNKCPWKDLCFARHFQLTDTLPNRTPLKKRKIIDRTLLIIRDGSRFLLQKRPDSGLLAGLYEFPGVDKKLSRKEVIITAEEMGYEPMRIKQLPNSKHIFTHLEWHMCAYEVTVARLRENDGLFVDRKELQQFAVPSAFKTYLDYYALRD